MTNAELISTIRKEIINRIDRRHLSVQANNELVSLLSFLSTLESEKPINQDELEKEMDACWQNWLSPSNQKEVEGVLPKTEFAMYARHFAEWGYLRAAEKYNEIEYNRQRAEESVPNDPEEAAEKYAKTTFKKPYSDNPDEEVTIVEPDKYAGFLAGAKWQKQHDAELIEIAYNDGITIGMTKQKEQMMKEAVEGEYDFYPAAVYLDVPIPRMNHGDKVRVIVIPNTDEK